MTDTTERLWDEMERNSQLTGALKQARHALKKGQKVADNRCFRNEESFIKAAIGKIDEVLGEETTHD